MIFCTFYIIFSLITYKQYGITNDEKARYSYGKALLSYFLNPVSKGLPEELLKEPDIYSFYTLVLNIFNPKFYYETFHLLNMLFALLIFITAYFLFYAYTKNQKLAILSPLMLLITPSFSGQIPANPIDVPLATAYLISLYLIYIFRNEKLNFLKIMGLGISFWFTQSIRPVGFSIYVVYCLFSIYIYFQNSRNKISLKTSLDSLLTGVIALILIFVVANFFMIITWPYIGLNYFGNLYSVIALSFNYSNWSKPVLFMGSFITHEHRPWFYLPVYIFLTTPLYIVVLYILNIISLRKLWHNQLLVLLNIPIIICFSAYLILSPIIYNGLRHFLFLIPLITLSACINLIYLPKRLVVPPVILNVLFVIVSIFQLHPFEYAYFNEITFGLKGATNSFETDYFGASYKESAEWIRNKYVPTSSNKQLKVYACDVSYAVDYYSHKKFITTIKGQEADLIICDYEGFLQNNYKGKILYTVKRQDTPLNFVLETPYYSSKI